MALLRYAAKFAPFVPGWRVWGHKGIKFCHLATLDRFWYENPSAFSPAQLAQIRASSLSSVMCDNGDDLGRATRDAFRVASGAEGEEGTVLCEEVPRMALQPWFECEDGEGLVSRPRRQNKRDTSSLLP